MNWCVILRGVDDTVAIVPHGDAAVVVSLRLIPSFHMELDEDTDGEGWMDVGEIQSRVLLAPHTNVPHKKTPLTWPLGKISPQLKSSAMPRAI